MTQFAEPNFPAVFTQDAPGLRQFDKNLITELGGMALNLKAILDRGISMDDNVDIRSISVTSHATPGTEFSAVHTLGKVPSGYIVKGQTAAGSIYDGTTSNTASTLYLKSDVGNVTFRILVY
jgi:hypothetical protein